MEDVRRIETLAAIGKDQQRELERLRRESVDMLAPRLNLRHILITLTLVSLGMIAWWGQ